VDPAAFQQYLHTHIPLSAAMATVVEEAGPDGVVLEAPLGPNLNHRATAFGGSVSSLAILAGWSLVHLRLRDQGLAARTVVQRSDVAYLEPVEDTFSARAVAPDGADWKRFVRTLKRWRRARVRVRVDVTSGGGTVATLDGDYVAMLGTDD
jgi:thioesterase domain-containing protein